MDWLSLLLIFVFFILPIIQQVIEQSRRGKAEPQEEMDEPVATMEGPRASTRRPEPVPVGGSGGWSEDWAPWPGSEQSEEAPEEAVLVEAAKPEEGTLRDRAEAERLATESESREYEARAERALRRAAELLKEREEARLIEPAQPRLPSRAPRHAPPVTRPVRRAVLAADTDLRRAIVLSEVLGPPVSLRSPLPEH